MGSKRSLKVCCFNCKMSVISKSVGKLFLFPFACGRNISTLRSVQEVRIPTSGGYLAGKWWGPADRRPILALHGWQDNCGSFNRLIPLLPEHIPVLTIDTPGHGYSYKYPPGIPYHKSDMPIILKELINYFGWKKVTLMGHSLGAIFCYTYGFLFPKEVDFLICIDGLHAYIHPRKMDRVPLSVEEFIKYNALQQSKEEPRSYTIEEMTEMLHLATRKSIALDTVKHILQRNIAPSKKYPGKFYYTRDARLKMGPLESPDPTELVRVATNTCFPIFLSKAETSPFFRTGTIFDEMLPILKKSNPDFEFHLIPGTHHVHLNEPEFVASLINEFIKKHDIDDRNYGGLKPEIIFNENVDNSLKMPV